MSLEVVAVNGVVEDIVLGCDCTVTCTTGASTLRFLAANEEPNGCTGANEFCVVIDRPHGSRRDVGHACCVVTVCNTKRSIFINRGDSETITNSLKLEKDLCDTVVVGVVKNMGEKHFVR